MKVPRTQKTLYRELSAITDQLNAWCQGMTMRELVEACAMVSSFSETNCGWMMCRVRGPLLQTLKEELHFRERRTWIRRQKAKR